MDAGEGISDERKGSEPSIKGGGVALLLALLVSVAVVALILFQGGKSSLPGILGTSHGPGSGITDLDPFIPDDAKAFQAPPPREQVPPVPGQTIVTLTFDDGWDSQAGAASAMADLGLPGTFFINSGSVGKPGYLTLQDLRVLAGQGHEVGGHTVSHPDLESESPLESEREICLDRATLSSWGFNVRNFAYPYAASTDQVRKATMKCGYNSSRSLGDVRTRFSCPECPPAETIPPANLSRTAAPDHITDHWTLQDLKDVITAAQPLGGWVQLTFHKVCTDSCDVLSVRRPVFLEFLSWLKSQTQTTPTVVRTVDEVIGGPLQPVVPIPGPQQILTEGEAGLSNPGLENLDKAPSDLPSSMATSAKLPLCWIPDSFGNNKSRFEVVSPGRSGKIGVSLHLENRVEGDAKLLVAMDLGTCAPEVTAGRAYSLKAWYKSSVPVQFSLYYRLERGVWVYWTSSDFYPPVSEYSQAQWTTPPIPEGVTALSYGLGLDQNGELTTDDYELTPAPEPPP